MSLQHLSAQKILREDNSPAVPTGDRTHDLPVTSLALELKVPHWVISVILVEEFYLLSFLLLLMPDGITGFNKIYTTTNENHRVRWVGRGPLVFKCEYL